MSEHSEHYHDADRNKPLPGVTVSSKEEVLQTLLTAAHGEITALTEANKLLAAQVAGPVLGSFDLDADLLGAIARGWCAKANANKVMDANLAFAIHHEVKALLDSRAAKVSARAADAPSEPSERAELLAVAEACVSQGCIIAMEDWLDARSAIGPSELRQALLDVRHSIQFSHDSLGGIDKMPVMMHHGGTVVEFIDAILSSRAADALDSQPTLAWLVDPGAGSAMDKVTRQEPDAVLRADVARRHGSITELVARCASSQPTDGEVRNG